MAWLDETLGGWGTTILAGVVVTIAAPVVLPALGSILRPVVKGMLTAGLTFAEALQETVAEGREKLGDLIAEIEAERAVN